MNLENIFNVRHTNLVQFFVIFSYITCDTCESVEYASAMVKQLGSDAKPKN